MKPIKFKESNVTLTGEGEIKNLPAFRNGEHIMSCWKMNLKEKISALIFGKVWLIVKSRKTQPPVSINIGRTGFK